MIPTPVLVGAAFLSLLVLLYFYGKSLETKPVTSTTGGTTSATSPSADKPIPPGGVTASAAVANTPSVHLIKKIKILKDTSAIATNPGNDNEGWRTFQVAEVFAYSGDRRLTADEFAAVEISSNYWPTDPRVAYRATDNDPKTFMSTAIEDKTGSLTLTLKTPMVISRVEVLNRQDCCWERLAGATLSLIDDTGATVWTGQLRGVRDVQLFSM